MFEDRKLQIGSLAALTLAGFSFKTEAFLPNASGQVSPLATEEEERSSIELFHYELSVKLFNSETGDSIDNGFVRFSLYDSTDSHFESCGRLENNVLHEYGPELPSAEPMQLPVAGEIRHLTVYCNAPGYHQLSFNLVRDGVPINALNIWREPFGYTPSIPKLESEILIEAERIEIGIPMLPEQALRVYFIDAQTGDLLEQGSGSICGIAKPGHILSSTLHPSATIEYPFSSPPKRNFRFNEQSVAQLSGFEWPALRGVVINVDGYQPTFLNWLEPGTWSSFERDVLQFEELTITLQPTKEVYPVFFDLDSGEEIEDLVINYKTDYSDIPGFSNFRPRRSSTRSFNIGTLPDNRMNADLSRYFIEGCRVYIDRLYDRRYGAEIFDDNGRRLTGEKLQAWPPVSGDLNPRFYLRRKGS